MIRRQDQKIPLSHGIQQNAQIFVKLLQFMSIALRISSVSPQSVEIYQIHKAKAMKIFSAYLDRLLHSLDGTV